MIIKFVYASLKLLYLMADNG